MGLVERISGSTPNDLFKVSPFRGVLLEKPLPEPSALSQVGSLPFKVDDKPEIIGVGDWNHSSCSGGNVVLDYGDFVVKVPLGVDSRDVNKEGKAQKEMIERFRGVSLPTAVVVTKVEPDLPPKLVIVQEKIEGQPVCKTPLQDLLNLKTLEDLKHILEATHQLCFETGVYDLYGQHFTEGCSFPFYLLPFFSDNIMAKSGGGAFLTDNTPGAGHRFLAEGSEKKISTRAKFASVRLLIDFLIILRKGWDWMSEVKN